MNTPQSPSPDPIPILHGIEPPDGRRLRLSKRGIIREAIVQLRKPTDCFDFPAQKYVLNTAAEMGFRLISEKQNGTFRFWRRM